MRVPVLEKLGQLIAARLKERQHIKDFLPGQHVDSPNWPLEMLGKRAKK